MSWAVRRSSSPKWPCVIMAIPTRSGVDALVVNVTVVNANFESMVGEILFQHLRDGHRSVASARAANGHGQIAFAFAHVMRQGFQDEIEKFLFEVLGQRVRLHIMSNRSILAGMR